MYYKWWRRSNIKNMLYSSIFIIHFFFVKTYFMTIERFSLSYYSSFCSLYCCWTPVKAADFYASNKNNKTITQNNKKLHLMIIAKKNNKIKLRSIMAAVERKKKRREWIVCWLIDFFLLNVPLTGNENKLCCNII